jgi:hypothetical protein
MEGVGKGVAVGCTDGEVFEVICWAGGKLDVAPNSRKAKAKARTGANSIFFLDQLTGMEPSSSSSNPRC